MYGSTRVAGGKNKYIAVSRNLGEHVKFFKYYPQNQIHTHSRHSQAHKYRLVIWPEGTEVHSEKLPS